jgi:FdhD protein
MNHVHNLVQYYKYENRQWDKQTSEVVTEMPVSLTINGEVWLIFMCTPVELDALAIGFLFNEGLINSRGEIASLHVCANLENVDVWLNHSLEKPQHWQRTSGCTGGVTRGDAPGIPQQENLNSLASSEQITPDTVCNLIIQLFEAQNLYRKSGGIHTSALSDGNQLRVVAEDIGRHNTIDKISGRCLLENIKLERQIILTTGRLSSEMLQKSARLGASIVISRTSPSSLSIKMASDWGITMIGYSHRDRFRVYTHLERIIL